MFFNESSSPKSLKISLWSFQTFPKILEIFASQGAPLVSMTPVANVSLVSTTSTANFATGTAGIVDTSGKFATDSNYTGAKLSPLSMKLAVNLPRCR
jgi:hypothetical protein